MRLSIQTLFLILCFSSCQQTKTDGQVKQQKIIVGAENTAAYLPQLQGKKIALVVNQTSVIHKTHLVDSLHSLGINISRIFCPEHGYKGKADAGQHIQDGNDALTGAPVISLYGKKKKPSTTDLADIDIILFDIQDVGARFYTYLSTLHYVLEAAAENQIKVMLLDRPNPNGSFIDGPVLEEEFSSFVGLHAVPIVYGMTIGEYGKMIIGEDWISNSEACELEIIALGNYNRDMLYHLPIKPSPNLPNLIAIKHYPSLCLFEGTKVSLGRGTSFPFQVYGHPIFKDQKFNFTPKSTEGAKHPKFKDELCYGYDLRKTKPLSDRLDLSYIIDSYRLFDSKNEAFFLSNNFFDKLAGTDKLRKQIIAGESENEIRESWQMSLDKFKKLRKQYLIYD